MIVMDASAVLEWLLGTEATTNIQLELSSRAEALFRPRLLAHLENERYGKFV